MARLTLDNVVKEFPAEGRRARPVRAIDHLSLDIADGEFLTVLGPSGCGKTTLLRLIAGLESVGSGTIAFDGRAVTHVEPQDRDVAMVFQRDGLLPHLTARENVELGLHLRGVGRTEIQARLRDAAGLLDLGAALDRRPGALSGGERQRVALARALVRRPRAFLLDEPFSALDAPLRAELRARLMELHRRRGTTIVHVTHDQAEALALGRRVAVFNRGALQQIAEPARLCRHPDTVWVAGFVGSPPMNLWRGTLKHEGGALWFRAEGGPDRLAVCLTEQQRVALADRPAPEIYLGLPAEHIVDPNGGRPVPYGCEVRATVSGVECLGSDALVRWTCGGSAVVTRCPLAQAPAVGTARALVFDMLEAHFFDGVSGRRCPGGKEEGAE